jgi:hypothetical protein
MNISYFDSYTQSDNFPSNISRLFVVDSILMGKSAAERKRLSRAKQSGERRATEREKCKLSMRTYRQRMDIEGRQEYHKAGAKRMKKSRALKKAVEKESKMLLQEQEQWTPSYKTLQAKAKAIHRVIRQLPRSPRKQKEIIQSLAKSHRLTIKEIEAAPKSERSNAIPLAVKECVKEFYLREDISRCSPSRKESVSIKLPSGERQNQQKHLLLLNIREAYEEFKKTFPETKIGVSKFATFRPENVRLVVEKDQETCCCPYCENLVLLLQCQASWLKPLPRKVIDLLQLLHCNVDDFNCMQGKCKLCTAESKETKVLSFFDDCQ